ncbi:MAG: glycosyltransferase family 2 protein [Candidatus Electrothrix sp. AW2]|nr:glycosyltransferase family 2 protein [Candidatus Electrothrix gigas]
MSLITISVIIVNYNTKVYTLECLRSIYEQTQHIDYEIIVVDNASSDGSAKAIEAEFPDPYLIKSKENLGFARANNLAAEKAKGEYILLLNPDTVILDGAIQKLYNFALAHPENLIYGGRTLFGDQSLNPTSCWKKMTLWSLFCSAMGLTSIFRHTRLFAPESYGSWQRDTVREVDIVTGCFLLIKKSFWNQLGGFSPEFFMYGEDADLCFRAKQQGARPIITPDATIIHYCGVSEKVRADKMIRLLRAKKQLVLRHWNIKILQYFGITLLRLAVFIRMLTLTILHSVGLNQFKEGCECWIEIWRRRQEWNFCSLNETSTGKK